MPLVSIGDGADKTWTEAMDAGNILFASDPLSGQAAQRFYDSQIGETMDAGPPIVEVLPALNVQLRPDVPVSDETGTEFTSLVMSWEENPGGANDANNNAGPSADEILNVAAWDYVYDADPDLTGLHIKFSLLPPEGVWDFSLEIFDDSGNSIGWFGVPPSTNWGAFSIDPAVRAPQGPFTAFFDDPVFDITRVAFIRLNESSQGGRAFIDDPALPGDSTTPWNAWNTFLVVPEPASAAVFGAGLVFLGWVRRRKGAI